MMMTQSYYGADFDSFNRPSHRVYANPAHYERPVPYTHAYYEPSHPELRSDYPGRPGTRTLIHEQGPESGPAGHTRRRIQVACSRCRRRKIKCSGDPGDGSGCSACKSANADKPSCTFNRVGSRDVAIAGVDMLPTSSSISSATPASASASASYSSDSSTSSYSSGLYQTHQRPSLPMLQTRTAFPEYDSYNTSPVDEYAYTAAAVPRHESFSSNFSTESFRPYTSASVPTPATSTSMYYEPGAAFSFGSLQAAPGYPVTPMTRLSSVSGEVFSPLNMSSLHSTLPTQSVPPQTVQERRLPIPYPQQQPTYTAVEVPQIRPLTSFTEPHPRAHIGGIYSRHGMSWSSGSPVVSRSGSTTNLSAGQHSMPLSSSAPGASSSLMTEPVLGYQFSASSGSPEVSPTTGPALSESYSSTSGSSTAGSTMLPPAMLRYSVSGSVPNLPALSGNDDQQRRPSTSHETAATLYSFSSGVDVSDRATPARQITSGTSDDAATPSHHYSRAPLRQPQPQHAASLDELRRRSSYDHQQAQRAATAHRMSVSNLNAHY
ncbi:hypothetical protein AC579_6946 [Pseudocercospora musae]|uniref:Zn(2)-C6 fungal-type domain-containing protein n=1 Tax=Pseudocercospora musae TaxID=113226 RepID=A0A139INW5_9PEZI|nr:hypothetical protein AC579_6946 [Pseudocercospora musae]